MEVDDEQDRSGWVDAAPFRAWVEHVMTTEGLSAAEVAVLAGVSPRITQLLLTGRRGRPIRRVYRQTAQRLLAVTPRRRRRSWVDAA